MIEPIAATYHWSHTEILELPIIAAFHYAMLASRRRWERFDDLREAASFPHFEENYRRSMVNRIGLMTSGPGIVHQWEETLDPQVREKLDDCDKERDEVFESLQRAGLLLGPDGKSPIKKLLGRA